LTTSDAWVHVRLPDGASKLVGRYRTIRPARSVPYGEFGYVKTWIEGSGSFPLDPDNLPLKKGTFITKKRALLPGALADATPDRWGRRIIEVSDPSPTIRTAADWLLASDEGRVGCLAFSYNTEAPQRHQAQACVSDLEELAESFEMLARGESAPPIHDRLWRAGGSLGGARPKATVEFDGALWIAKFQRADDEWDQCAAEHAAMKLAASCGIEAAETRIFNFGLRKAVLVRRFDRTNAGGGLLPSAHYISAQSLLDIDDTSDSGSYQALAACLRRISSSQADDRIELFRRMVFNVLAGNRDDHLKNHGIIRDGSGWRLAPAFDVVPQPDMDNVQAISVGRFGSYSTVANCLTMCGEFGLSQDDAKNLVNQLVEQMRPWRSMFAAWGVDNRTVARLGKAFAPLIDAEPERPGLSL